MSKIQSHSCYTRYVGRVVDQFSTVMTYEIARNCKNIVNELASNGKIKKDSIKKHQRIRGMHNIVIKESNTIPMRKKMRPKF